MNFYTIGYTINKELIKDTDNIVEFTPTFNAYRDINSYLSVINTDEDGVVIGEGMGGFYTMALMSYNSGTSLKYFVIDPIWYPANIFKIGTEILNIVIDKVLWNYYKAYQIAINANLNLSKLRKYVGFNSKLYPIDQNYLNIIRLYKGRIIEDYTLDDIKTEINDFRIYRDSKRKNT